MSSSIFFRLLCGILRKVSAGTEMSYEAADLKLRSETTHFDMPERRRSAIRGFSKILCVNKLNARSLSWRVIYHETCDQRSRLTE